LTTDFFAAITDMGIEWSPSTTEEHVYEGRDRVSGDSRGTATAVDLVFGSHSQLRGIAEVYACDDAQPTFVRDFVAAWDKVMSLDRFDLRWPTEN
jgi:catalase-peroxidase